MDKKRIIIIGAGISGLTAGTTYVLTITVLDIDGNATAKVSLKA